MSSWCLKGSDLAHFFSPTSQQIGSHVFQSSINNCSPGNNFSDWHNVYCEVMGCNLIHCAERVSGARFLPPTGLSVNTERKASAKPKYINIHLLLHKSKFPSSVFACRAGSWLANISDVLFLVFSISLGPISDYQDCLYVRNSCHCATGPVLQFS